MDGLAHGGPTKRCHVTVIVYHCLQNHLPTAMKKELSLLPIVFVFYSLAAFGQDGLSARQIIEKNIEAQGGRATLQGIQTVYTEFATRIQGHDCHVVIKEMLPNKGSFAIIYQGRTVYESVFNGQQGFDLQNGKKVPEPADDNKDKFFKKNIFNELDYLDTTLYTIQLLPEAKVGEEPVYVIKASLQNGAEHVLYYSKKTFLELKSERTKLPENERSNATVIDQWSKYHNIMYPSQERMFVGTDHEETLTLLNIYFNEKVSDADFQ
jgi:hypothetical protein